MVLIIVYLALFVNCLHIQNIDTLINNVLVQVLDKICDKMYNKENDLSFNLYEEENVMVVLKKSLDLLNADKVYAMSSRSEHRSQTYCSCSCGK